MPSIDERIVSISFDNAKFEANVAVTMTTLGKLNVAIAKTGTGPNGLDNIEKAASKIKLDGVNTSIEKTGTKFQFLQHTASNALGNIASALFLKKPAGKDAVDEMQAKLDKGFNSTQAFSDVEAAASKVRFESLHAAIDGVGNKFSVMAGAAAVAIGNIASQVATKGFNFAKSFGIGPVLDGLKEYETNLQSIQTVQANTDRPLTEINKSLEELNRYSDQTIYNFSEMAKNIGTFTAAGVDLKTATSSIKGIANMAALSGSTSQQASTAMYQLSQAISSGRVGLQDWNSVVNAGMGGKKLQTALVTTGQAMGDVSKSAMKFEGPMKKLTINGKSFRESIMAKPGEQSWLTSDILVNTLATLDGRFSKAALSAELTKDGLRKYTDAQVEAKMATARSSLEAKNGVKYTDAQFASLQKLSDSAFKSATEVKTLGQVFDVAKETIGSGWAASFQNIFGNLTEAKELFTGMSGVINGFINKTSLARNTLLAGWKAMGGRDLAIQGLKNIFNVLGDVFTKVGKAFREVFPKKTSQDLFNMTEKFAIFTAHLNNSPEIFDNIARTAKGFFAVLHIGWTIVKGLIGVVADLLGAVGKGGGGFLSFTGSIGDFLVGIDTALTKGSMLTTFFDGLSGVLKVPLKLITGIGSVIGGLFSDETAGGAQQFSGAMDGVTGALTPLENLLNKVKNAWNNFRNLIGDIKEKMEPWLSNIAEKIKGFATMIAQAIESADWGAVMTALQTSFIGGMFLMVKKALDGGVGQLGGGLLKNINGVLGGVKTHLTAMQAEIKANVLLKIAGAIALLAISIGLISLLEPKKLATAMSAIAVGLGQLMGAMALMTKMGGGMGKSAALMPVMASSLLIMAGALVVLALAMHIMARLSWEEMAKGLIGIGGALMAVGLGIKFIGPGLGPAALAMIPLALGILLLAIAVGKFADMKWEELARGLGGVLAVLGALALGMAALPTGQMVLAGAGLILIGVGLSAIAGAVAIFAKMPLDKLFTGLFGLAGSLAAIGLAIMLIPPTMALQAAGLIILGVALQGIAGAIILMGNLKLETIIQGLTAIAGVLLIFAIGLTAMAGTLPGAAALLAAGIALAFLAPALALLGQLKWSTIIKGLIAISLVMGVLSILGPLTAPGLTSLAGSIALLGLAMIPAALAVMLFAKGLSLLGDAGQKGVATFLLAVTALIASLPVLVINFAKGLLEIIDGLKDLLPKVVVALGVIIDTIIAFVIKSAPSLAIAIGVLVDSIITVLIENVPKLIEAGVKLITALLKGIADYIGQVVPLVATIIVTFLDSLTAELPRIIASGTALLVSFLLGVSNKIGQVIIAGGVLIIKFLEGLAKEAPKIVIKAAALITKFLSAIASRVPGIVKAGANIIIKFINGIGDALPDIVKAGTRVIKKFISAVGEAGVDLANAGFRVLIKFLRGIEKAIRDNSDDLFEAGAGIADAILDGLVEQFGKLGGVLRSAINKVFSILPGAAKKILGISSPSKVFAEIGKQTMMGMAVGLSDSRAVDRSIAGAATNVVSTAQGAFGKIPSMLDGLIDADPVITPVLDLTNVERGAKKMHSNLANVVPISAAVSYDQAKAISSEKQVIAEAAQVTQEAPRQPMMMFEQNNYSPESLSDVEIYRRTNNQLSQVKAALNAPSRPVSDYYQHG